MSAVTGTPVRGARISQLAATIALLGTLCLLACALSPQAASAESPAPWWLISATTQPTSLTPEACGGPGQPSCPLVVVTAENIGDASTSGTVTVSAQLPATLVPVAIKGVAGSTGKVYGPVNCTTLHAVTCTFERNGKGEPGALPPFEAIEMRVSVRVQPEAATGETITAAVSGGGASESPTASRSIDVSTEEAFQFEEFSLIPEREGGAADTQAGSHPFQLTAALALSTSTPDVIGNPRTVALPKNIITELPPGLIGNPSPFPQCTDAEFDAEQEIKTPESEQKINDCPASSAIGAVNLTFDEPDALHLETISVPVFNMTPNPREPARFGFEALGVVSAFLDTSIRTGSDYGVTVSSLNLPQIDSLIAARLTFWGVPGASQHDDQRGWQCLYQIQGPAECSAQDTTQPPPFLIMPSSCEAPFTSTLRGESWGSSARASQTAAPLTSTLSGPIDGCNHLPFAAEIRVTPDGNAASTPTGLNVDVHVPQSSILDAESLSESALRNIMVALPEGVAVNPSGSDGLESCSEGLAGFAGFSGETAGFTPTLPEPEEPGTNICPTAAKIGTVTIKTPLLPVGQNLEGSVYLATQNQNPFGSLIALYIVAKDPISGTVVKLTGETQLTATGQIVTTFKNSPQLAFEDAELHFFGGERAPLATPARCGAYTTDATFTPWAENGDVTSTSTFNITSGPKTASDLAGSPCPGPTLPFSPALTGGTTNINAGSFSPLSTTIGREDGDQNLQSVQLHMPEGVQGLLTGVKLCPEAQANEGTCGPESLIGESTVSVGVGNDPVSVVGGKVYLTEKYAGAPFGLSIVNPVKAGPFDLERDTSNPAQNPPCDCVVVRAKIEVSPRTAELTVTTDPSGPHAIPHLIDGIPVQIKKVNVLINREHFIFNPTSCNPLSLTGAIASDEGLSDPVSVPFQVANCANLKFTPDISFSTSGKTSKQSGADLITKVTYPSALQGTYANIGYVKVELPKALPSRLTTLQKACLAKVFEENPAKCPPESKIGYATVHTPVLPVPLEGPAIFVSHGGEEFPSLTIILQGYGVTIDLVGTTFISKAGITSTTFKTVPDTPFSTFELVLPQGPYSALAANGNLCKQKLVIPNEWVGANGAVLRQDSTMAVTGCAPAITVVSHRVKGNAATIQVKVPSAGKLVASGKGLSKASEKAKGASTLTVKLTLTNGEAAVLSKHKGRKLKAEINLTFTPKTGGKLKTSATVIVG